MVKARITTKGQVTVPKQVRDRMGLRAGDEIEFIEEDEGFRVRKLAPEAWLVRWSGYLKHLEGMDPDALVEEMRGR